MFLPLPGLHGWGSLGEDVPDLAGTRVRWYPRGLPFSKEKGRRQWGAGNVRVQLGRDEVVGL